MNFLFSHKKLIIILYACLVLLAGFFVTKIDVIHSPEKFFPRDDDDLDFLNYFESRMEADDNYLLIAVRVPDGQKVFDYETLKKITELRSAVEDIPQVTDVYDITNYRFLLKTPMGYSTIKALPLDKGRDYQKDAIRLMQDERIGGKWVSRDTSAALMLIKHEDYLSAEDGQDLKASVMALLDEGAFPDFYVSGRIFTQSLFIEKITDELFFYTLLSNVLLVIILIWLYRSFWGVFVPMVSVIGGLIIFLGILGLLKVPLDLISSLYPPLMLIIGMSDVIHIKTKYLDELREGKSREAAMRVTIKEIGLATLLTSATTAIGFLALLTSRLEPIRNFGLYAALGIFVAYFSVIFFTCTLLLYFDEKDFGAGKRPRVFRLFRPAVLDVLVFKHQKKWIALFLFLVIGAFWGGTQITTNTYLLGDVPKEDRLRKDFLFFENQFSGARPFEVAIMPDTLQYGIWSPEVLKETEKLVNYMEEKPIFKEVISPVTLMKTWYQAEQRTTSPEAYRFPETDEQLEKGAAILEKRQGVQIFKLTDDAGQMGRITAKVHDLGSDSIKVVRQEMEAWMDANINQDLVQFRITGKPLILDKNSEYLVDSLFKGLGLAFLTVGLLMVLLFKNLKLFLISFVPNALPLLFTAGLMGFLGIELKSSTSIIFTIAFGIAVDDTIHFLTRFKLAKMAGKRNDRALSITFAESGKAIFLTTLVLLSGFIALAFSDFVATYYVGLLVSITLVSALIADLTILPILLRKL